MMGNEGIEYTSFKANRGLQSHGEIATPRRGAYLPVGGSGSGAERSPRPTFFKRHNG